MFEHLDGSNDANNTTNGISDVLLFIGILEGLNSHVSHQKSLIFIMNAHEEVLNVDVCTEWLKHTLVNLGKLLFLLFLEIVLGLFTYEDLGSHGSALESKVLPVLGLIICDGSTHS